MPKYPFATAFQKDQRAKELRKLNDALKARSSDEDTLQGPATTKLAEAILRARKVE